METPRLGVRNLQPMRVAQEPVDGPKALDAASLDAAGNPATTVRNDPTYETVIYTLGYSGGGG